MVWGKKLSVLVFGIVLSFFLLPSNVEAADLEASNGIIFTSTQSTASQAGFLIEVGSANISIVNFTKNSTSTATRAILKQMDGTEIATATFSGDTATFSPIQNLTANIGYRIHVDNSGASYTNAYSTTISYPINSTDLTWVIGSNGASSNESGYGASIIKLGYRTGSSVSENLNVTLNSPADGATVMTVTPAFNFTSTNSNSSAQFVRATLFINGTAYGNNASAIANNTAMTITANVSLTNGQTYQWWINLTDDSHIVNSTRRSFTIDLMDTTPPTWQSQGQNDTILENGSVPILLFARGQDNIALDWAILATNETGSFQNKTITAWNVNTASYDNISFNFLGLTSEGEGIFFKPDGTRLFVLGNQDEIFQINLTNSWNLSSAVYSGSLFNYGIQESDARDIFFKPDGTKMYILGGAGDSIFQYSLTTAWNLSSTSYDSVFFNTSAQMIGGTPHGLFFRDDGLKFYIATEGLNLVYQYTLSSAWNVSTAVYDNVSFNVSSQENVLTDIVFRPSGSKMYIIGVQTDTIYQYDLASSWNISTATYSLANLNVSIHDNNHRDLFFREDGIKLYVTGSDSGRVYQYTLNSSGDQPVNMNDSSSLSWSNFTWTNSSITNRTTVAWKIYYNDTSGNSNVTDTLTFVVGQSAPNVFLESPDNGSSTTDDTPDFQFRANDSDGDALAAANLYIDGVASGTNSTGFANDASHTITSNRTLEDGFRSWLVSVKDSLGAIGNSSSRTLKIAIPPQWRSQNSSDKCINAAGGDTIQLHAQGFDNTALDFAALSTNETGEWQNKSGAYGSPMGMNDTEEAWITSNFTWTNTSIADERLVGWRIHYNDTVGSDNTTDVRTFRVNSPLPKPVCEALEP